MKIEQDNNTGIQVTELIQFLVQVLHEKGNIPVRFWSAEYGEPSRTDSAEVSKDFTDGDKPIVLLK